MNTPPILLVHGIDDSGARFRKMRSVLLAHGLGPVYTMDIIPNDASIPFEAMGQQVASAVRQLQQETHAEKIDLIAFSMGALAARYFIQRLEGRERIRRFISISGPHHGTLTAHFLRKAGIRQMRPNSALLQELNSDPDPWGEVQVFSFWSSLDLMILPASSSFLPLASNHTFPVVLHPLMLTDTRVVEAVTRSLQYN